MIFKELPTDIMLKIFDTVGDCNTITCISKETHQEYKWKASYNLVIKTILVHGMFFRFKTKTDWRGRENRMIYCYNNFYSSQEVWGLLYHFKQTRLRKSINYKLIFIRNIRWFGLSNNNNDTRDAVKEFLIEMNNTH